MQRSWSRRTPLAFALLVYWLFTLGLLKAAQAEAHGHFGYPLDDAYIHMAMARHLVQDGFWGISSSGFSSSTSSPLWTFLIAAADRMLGVNDWIPLALCFLFGSLVVVYCDHLLATVSNPARRTVYLLFVVLLTPLPVLTAVGMEHVLQSLMTVAIIYMAASYLAAEAPNRRLLAAVASLAGLASLTRYEGLFLVFVIVVLLLIQRRFAAAAWIAAAGAMPVTAYGIWSMRQGWYFLPNSVLLKGSMAGLTPGTVGVWLLHWAASLQLAPHVLVLLLAVLIAYLLSERQGILSKQRRYLAAIFVPMLLLHMQFAAIGWLSRYEAYIVLAGIVILMDLLDTLIRHEGIRPQRITMAHLAAFVLAIVFLSPLMLRMADSFTRSRMGVRNIYEQQYQMGRFLAAYYSGKTVAANDIGAIDYLANVKTLDLYGLGSMQVARAKLNGTYGAPSIQRLSQAQNAEIAVIHTSWFEGEIPPDWVEVGRWEIQDNYVCAEPQVTFYAPGSAWEQSATEHLRGFSALLPTTVKQSGAYLIP